MLRGAVQPGAGPGVEREAAVHDLQAGATGVAIVVEARAGQADHLGEEAQPSRRAAVAQSVGETRPTAYGEQIVLPIAGRSGAGSGPGLPSSAMPRLTWAVTGPMCFDTRRWMTKSVSSVPSRFVSVRVGQLGAEAHTDGGIQLRSRHDPNLGEQARVTAAVLRTMGAVGVVFRSGR